MADVTGRSDEPGPGREGDEGVGGAVVHVGGVETQRVKLLVTQQISEEIHHFLSASLLIVLVASQIVQRPADRTGRAVMTCGAKRPAVTACDHRWR